MIVFASSELDHDGRGERRAALTPRAVEKLTRLGMEVHVGAGLGAGPRIPDEAYRKAGARLRPDVEAARAEADVIARVSPPDAAWAAGLREAQTLVSFLDPFREGALVRALAASGARALCMELVPRTTYAQKMDALSSQASLAGYAAVIRAAARSAKAFPMMTTPAGTIPPARVFVVGVGVAGLQAIATAKRLGARVEAYDTRPVVAEQVRSLGARFVEIDVGETGQTAQGYARALTDEQLAEQRRQMAKVVASADVVITTAQLFGRPAPRIVDDAMVAGMRPGSVIVDLAASTGGNVEGSAPEREVERHGVAILGLSSLPAEVALDASEMYASNVANLLEHAWDAEAGSLRLGADPGGADGAGAPPADDPARACLLVAGGRILHEGVAAASGADPAPGPESAAEPAPGRAPAPASREESDA